MRHRLPDYLEHMAEAAGLACSYVKDMSQAAFLADKRTQQAVILNLLILGEAAPSCFRSMRRLPSSIRKCRGAA